MSKKFSTKLLALLLAVMLMFSTMAFSVFAEMFGFGGSDMVDIHFDDASKMITVEFSAEEIADILETRSLTKQDLRDMLPNEVIDAYRLNGIVGVIASDAVMDVASLDQILDIFPSAILERNISLEKVQNLFGSKFATLKSYMNLEEVENRLMEAGWTEPQIVGVTPAEIYSALGFRSLLKCFSNMGEAVNIMNMGEFQDIVMTVVIDVLSSANDITVNGDSVFPNWKISPAAFETAILKGLPADDGALMSAIASRTIVTYELVAEFDDPSVDDLRVGLTIGLYGEDASLAKINEYVPRYLTYSVDPIGSSAVIDATIPSIISNLITKALDSARVSDSLKSKLLNLMNGTVNEAVAMMEALTVDDLKTVLTAAGRDDIVSLINKKATVAEQVRTKFIAFLQRLPDNTSPIADYYVGNGAFHADLNKGVTAKAILDRALKALGVTQDVSTFIKMDEMVSASLDMTWNFDDLYELEFVTDAGTVFNAYVPAGTEIAKITSLIPELDSIAWEFENGDDATIAVMPAEDTSVYYNSSYTISFYEEDGTTLVATVSYKYGRAPGASEIPAVPEKFGFDSKAWFINGDLQTPFSGFDYTSGTVKVIARYSDKSTLYIDFKQEDGSVTRVPYIFGDSAASLRAPAVKEKFGYNGAWEAFTSRMNKESVIVVNPVYTKKTFYIYFEQEFRGRTVVTYTYGDPIYTVTNKEPSIDTKVGYTGEWEAYGWKFNRMESFTVRPIYTPMTYEVIFVQENGDKTVVKYQYGDTSIKVPAVAEKAGYHGEWESYALNKAASLTVHAKYLPNTMTVVFEQEDGTRTEVAYSFGDSSVKEPAVKAKEGYNGAWAKYELNKEDVTVVKAVYTPKIYTVIFTFEDGTTEEVKYAYGVKSIEEPAIPAKEGFTAAWESYVLSSAETITVRAVYTATGDDTPVIGWDIVDGVLVVKANKGSLADLLKNGVDLTDAFKAAEADGRSIRIVGEGATATFDATAVKEAIASGKDVVLTISPKAVGSVEMKLDGVELVNGTVAVDIDFVATKPKNVCVYSVAADGAKTKLDSTYADGKASFTTKTFGVFAAEEVEPKSNATTWIVAGAATAVAAGGAAVGIILSKKKKAKA